MPLHFRPRRVLFLVLLVVILAVALVTLHREMHRAAAPPGDFTKQELQSPQSNTPQKSPSYATEFAFVAEREISQLDGTITPARWKTLHQGERSSEANGYYCPDLEKTDSLSSGAATTRRAYFYPP